VVNTDIVLICLGTRDNLPGVSVVQDGTRAVVKAMSLNNRKPNRLIIMTTALCNEKSSGSMNWFVRMMINFMLNNIKADHLAAEAFLQLPENKWVQWTVFQPPQIIPTDEEVGYLVSVDQLIPNATGLVTFRDCARFMLRAAEGIESTGTSIILQNKSHSNGIKVIEEKSREAVLKHPHGKGQGVFIKEKVIIDTKAVARSDNMYDEVKHLAKVNFKRKVVPVLVWGLGVGVVVFGVVYMKGGAKKGFWDVLRENAKKILLKIT
jgi:hypothetical protein